MIRIIAVGKVKDRNVSLLVEKYLKRCKRVTIDTVKESKKSSVPLVKKEEGERLLGKCGEGLLCAMSEEGKVLSSKAFASFLKNKKVTFVIGGAHGLDGSVKKKADKIISLSPMTFPHELAQLLLVEQVYRAQTILDGKKYHK